MRDSVFGSLLAIQGHSQWDYKLSISFDCNLNKIVSYEFPISLTGLCEEATISGNLMCIKRENTKDPEVSEGVQWLMIEFWV